MMTNQLREKIFIDINGVRQGMFLQSNDTQNPVLLFLHGGPGSPEIAFTQNSPTGLEHFFTVCWWEQRGSGISYDPDIPRDSLTMDQMIGDAIAVTDYLRRRFGQDKIYLMGHSWGSALGVLTAKRVPERFHAYIGIGQIACQRESELLAYAYMLDQFRAAGNQRMVRKLLKFPIDKGAEIDNRYLAVRSEGMMKLGIGITHGSTSMMDAVAVILRYRGYTWREKLNYPRGSLLALNCLWGAVMATDFMNQVPRLEVPFYVFQGKFDYQVSYVLARNFVQAIDAPVKGFYTFEDSAHSPCFEEPDKMIRILRGDVLQGKADLADRS